MTNSVGIPLFKKADLDASIGVFFDGFSKVIVAIAILAGTFGMAGSMVFGTVVPGIVLGVVLCNGGLWLYYRKIAKDRNDPNLTAIPGGMQAGRIFIWLYSIMLPVFTASNDANLALNVGLFAHFLSGAIFVVGAFVVPKLLNYVPKGALFGVVAGGCLAFLALQSFDTLLKMPIVGWISFLVLFTLYLARINTKIPVAFIAILIGAVVAWVTGNMSVDSVVTSLENLSFQLPKLTIGLFAPEVMSATLPFLPIIVVYSVGEIITNIQAVEQAKECGDDYFNAVTPTIISGAASMISSMFGNPLGLGLYWGYPGWKEMKVGTGYHLGVAVLYAVVGLTGLTAIINAVIPEATVMPVLIFIGVTSAAQGFQVVTARYYPAVVVALIPVLIDWIGGNAAEGVLVGFQGTLAGAAFIGMIWGAMIVYIIDRKWINVTITSAIALVLSVIGMIHCASVIFTESYVFPTNWVIIYVITGVVFAVLHLIKFNPADPEAEEKVQEEAKEEAVVTAAE